MKTLVLNHDQVAQLLPMLECIEVMQDALSALARGEADQPLRTIFEPDGVHGVMAMMPSFRRSQRPMFGLKAICVFPGNAAKGKDAHQGSVLLFNGETGEPLALMNASAITEIRTGAVSAVATRLLAREDASELAIIGAGVQARSHLAAIACVRKLRRARVASRLLENARKFTDEMQTKHAFPIEPVATAEEAIRGADVIVTATTSHEPVLNREWISQGAHINAVGTYSFAAREVDTATMVAAKLFVDRRESALNEAGDYLIAARERAIGPDHIRAEIGELLIGAAYGRETEDEITIFKSLGLAIEDLAAAQYLYDKAEKAQAGTWVEF